MGLLTQVTHRGCSSARHQSQANSASAEQQFLFSPISRHQPPQCLFAQPPVLHRSLPLTAPASCALGLLLSSPRSPTAPVVAPLRTVLPAAGRAVIFGMLLPGRADTPAEAPLSSLNSSAFLGRCSLSGLWLQLNRTVLNLSISWPRKNPVHPPSSSCPEGVISSPQVRRQRGWSVLLQQNGLLEPEQALSTADHGVLSPNRAKPQLGWLPGLPGAARSHQYTQVPTGKVPLGRGDLLLSHRPDHSCELTTEPSCGKVWVRVADPTWRIPGLGTGRCPNEQGLGFGGETGTAETLRCQDRA